MHSHVSFKGNVAVYIYKGLIQKPDYMLALGPIVFSSISPYVLTCYRKAVVFPVMYIDIEGDPDVGAMACGRSPVS